MKNVSPRFLHIGIIGCSSEGAALCYRSICSESSRRFGRHAHPEISMHTHSLSDYMLYIDRDDWRGVGDVILSSARKLHSIGCEFLICPDNTIHQALPFIEHDLPLPWLHIAEVVAMEALTRGFKKVGITGTRWLVESSVYPKKLKSHDLQYFRPKESECEKINQIIMDELVLGKITDDSIDYFLQVIQNLKKKGCDAVILGCTEIPLIINDSNSSLPILDSTRLLAYSALEKAIVTN